MFLLSEKDGVHRVAGDELGETIEACIRWCDAKDCQVLLNFNGVERHIKIWEQNKVVVQLAKKYNVVMLCF